MQVQPYLYTAAMLIFLLSSLDSSASQLHDAIMDNNQSVVKALISQGVPVNSEDENGRTALYVAAWRGNGSLVKMLINSGADVDRASKNDDGFTPLIIAAYQSDEAVADILLQNGANVDAEDRDGYTALSWAWESESWDMVKLLINKGANLGATPVNNKQKDTFLHLAFLEKNMDLAKFLIANGANYHAKNRSGFSPICTSNAYSDHDVVKLFIENGEKFTEYQEPDCIPLHAAVYAGNLYAVKIMLNSAAKSSINANGFNGETALYLSVKNNNLEVLKILLEHGADPNISDVFGFTPLHKAAKDSNLLIAKLLIEHGADVNKGGTIFEIRGRLASVSFPGHTPLHASVDSGNIEIAKLLITHGANLNAKATGRMVINQKIIRYSDITPLELALLYEKHKPGSRRLIAEVLRNNN